MEEHSELSMEPLSAARMATNPPAPPGYFMRRPPYAFWQRPGRFWGRGYGEARDYKYNSTSP